MPLKDIYMDCCDHHWRHVYAIVSFIAIATGSVSDAQGMNEDAPSGLLSTNAPFAVHLLNPPWIKEALFVSSELHVAGEKQIWINATNRAAIRPNGMFLERLTASPFGPKPAPGLLSLA
jgi:hypothetical protein